MLLCPSALAYANIEPAFFDFENYTQDHTSPAGWASGNTWELGPGIVDEAHGTSFKVKHKGLPAYTFADPVSSGEFLVSFEIYFEDFEQNLRLHAKSPTSGKDSHSLLQFTAGEVKCANTSEGAWIFDKMTSIETNRWYQIDLLFNMDSGKLYYYVDGIEYATKTIAFSDMSTIYFRTESGKNDNATLYLDNVSFKYKSAGSFDSEFKGGIAQIGQEEIILNFQDLVDSNTIDNIEIYNMGNDPFSYSSHKIDAEAEIAGVKSVRLMLSEPIEKNSIYKVYAPGVKTIFGDSFTNETTYFATGGATTNRVSINADFSTITATGLLSPISPSSDITWEKSVRKINTTKVSDLPEKEGEETTVVRFVKSEGSEELPDNLAILTRDIYLPYTNAVDMEFMIKAKNGKQTFRVKDSQSNEVELIKIEGQNVIINDNAVSQISADIWHKFYISISSDMQTMQIKIDGTDVFQGDITNLNDISGVAFEQRNCEETYDMSPEDDELAEMMIAYFKLYAEEECTSAILVNFEDEKGNLYYPDGEIPTDVIKMNLVFSEELNEDTIDGGVTFAMNGFDVSEDYEYANGIYSVIIPDYLTGKSDYIISIKDTIKDTNNAPVMVQEGTVTTDSGLFSGISFRLQDIGDSYNVSGELIHTDMSCDDIYVSLASYKGNLLIGYQLEIITPTWDDRKIEFSNTYEKNEDADKVIAYLWDGFEFMNPILKAQSIQ